MTGLAALLAAAGLFVGGWPVTIDPHPPYPGALGLACAAAFRSIPGNAQDRCPLGYEGRVLYPAALRDRKTAQNILLHEGWHLAHTEAGPADDPFQEREAYGFACRLVPVADLNVCPDWRNR